MTNALCSLLCQPEASLLIVKRVCVEVGVNVDKGQGQETGRDP